MAGLLRLELLYSLGGIWVDSDVEPYRSLEPLLGVRGFAAWEDERVVPDAVLGAEAGHPAIEECLSLALAAVAAGKGAWESGPGVTTAVLPGRDDWLLLPPGAFYPYHYTERCRRGEDHRASQPWAFTAHHWAASWHTPAQKAQLDARQRFPQRRA
jgi:mannosyltransferase OCH1-like enzyme